MIRDIPLFVKLKVAELVVSVNLFRLISFSVYVILLYAKIEKKWEDRKTRKDVLWKIKTNDHRCSLFEMPRTR